MDSEHITRSFSATIFFVFVETNFHLCKIGRRCNTAGQSIQISGFGFAYFFVMYQKLQNNLCKIDKFIPIAKKKPRRYARRSF